MNSRYFSCSLLLVTEKMHLLGQWISYTHLVNEVNDIIDGFYLKVLIVGKLVKFFQIQYYPFIAIFFVPSKNTRNKFIFIWCIINNN